MLLICGDIVIKLESVLAVAPLCFYGHQAPPQ